MIAFSLAITVGTAFAFWGNALIDSHWLTYLPILLWLAWQRPDIRFICLCWSAFLWSSFLFGQMLEKGLDPAFDGQTVLLTGTIIDISQQRGQSIRFYLKPDDIQSYQKPLPVKLRLSWYHSQQVPQAGQRWQLLVKLRAPRGFQNPGGFDYERWLFSKNIAATGYVKKSDKNRMLATAAWHHINHHRLQITRAIDRACAECKYHGLFKALTVGYRGDIPQQQNRLLRDTGTAHLLAISGLHVGLVAVLFYGLGAFLWRHVWCHPRFNQRECSALLAAGAALSYAALAGFSLPTVRALVMLMVVVLALLLRKNINLLNSIASAMCLILLVNPLAIGSISFWLSISALLVIAFGQPWLANQNSGLKRLLMIQMLFFLLLIPISILLFQQATPAGFIANIVAIPLLSFIILPLTLISALFAILDLPLASVLFNQLDRLTGWLLDYLQLLLASGLQTYSKAGHPVLLLACMGIGLVFALLPVGWRTRVPALLLLLIAILWQPPTVDADNFQMTALDVGMGTAVVVETQHHSLIYDFGPGTKQGFSAGDWVVKPFLQYRGITQPDLMIVSHVDSDHSGGFISFIDQTVTASLPTAPLLTGMPDALEKRFDLSRPVRSCHDYPAWHWDGIDFEFLVTQPRGTITRSNNHSCVLKISGRHTALLTGDIEAAQENKLRQQWIEKLAADILLVPHHGSLTSSTRDFIKVVSPVVAVFTVGRNNRWAFPKPAVIDRYRQINSTIIRTDQQGAVSLLSWAEGLSVATHRRYARIWHHAQN